MNKAGSQITFYYPVIQEMELQKKQDNGMDEDQDDEKDGAEGNGNIDDNQSQLDKTSQDDGDNTDNEASSPLRKGRKRLNTKDIQKEDEDNDQNLTVYQYRAVGSHERVAIFQCNLTEIFFELVGI